MEACFFGILEPEQSRSNLVVFFLAPGCLPCKNSLLNILISTDHQHHLILKKPKQLEYASPVDPGKSALNLVKTQRCEISISTITVAVKSLSKA